MTIIAIAAALAIVLILGMLVLFRRRTAATTTENFRIATHQDDMQAMRHAYKKLCERQPGRKWIDGPNNSWDCVYGTRESCMNASVYPTLEDTEPHYYEWREDTKKCVVGNEAWRAWCDKEGLKYDPDTGRCRVTREYCLKKQLNYCNGDCYQPPVSWVAEQIFGATLGRAINNVLPEKWITQAACDL